MPVSIENKGFFACQLNLIEFSQTVPVLLLLYLLGVQPVLN